MKRLTLLAAVLTLVLGMAATSMAAPEVTVSGNIPHQRCFGVTTGPSTMA